MSYKPGLEGVIAAETRLSHVDGEAGRLVLAGYELEAIAPRVSFEAMVYLMWHDVLPTAAQLADFAAQLAAERAISPATVALLTAAAQAATPPMDALRMGADALSMGLDTADLPAQAVRILAALPTIVATYARLAHGRAPIPPDPALGHAANYLYMLTGERPTAAQARGLETYLNTVIDHGLNASTFAARVIIATQSDLVSAVVGGIGALKGPLHGGAPGPALDMVFEIGTAERAEPYLRQKLAAGERLMGFGHRVYKVRDPRADVLAAAAEQMFAAQADQALYTLAQVVEKTAVRLLAEYKPGRRLDTNVEFYTALLLHGLGLETAQFTPTFAIGRAAGWLAHCLEQLATGRLIRPQSRYVGEMRIVDSD